MASLRAVGTFPAFDSGRYEGSDFLMSNGDAILTVRIAEAPPFRVRFSRVRWHQFTALSNCSAEQIEGAYFKVVEITDSQPLEAYIRNDRAPRKAYRQLHHYRVFLDETGCHEIFSESCCAL
jgi:hypothetical protein